MPQNPISISKFDEDTPLIVYSLESDQISSLIQPRMVFHLFKGKPGLVWMYASYATQDGYSFDRIQNIASLTLVDGELKAETSIGLLTFRNATKEERKYHEVGNRNWSAWVKDHSLTRQHALRIVNGHFKEDVAFLDDRLELN